MIDRYGNEVGNFFNEKRKYAAPLTTQRYLEMLAAMLNTPARLSIFFQNFFRHVPEQGEYYQSAHQTIRRIFDESPIEKMQGDCDDRAFLAENILRLQGKKPFVVYIPAHAFCVWMTKRRNGRVDASCIDGSLEHNGVPYGMRLQEKQSAGFRTASEAYNAVLAKYRRPKSLVPLANDDSIVHLLDINNPDRRISMSVSNFLPPER
ncbi:hypothetical protein HYZ99_03055 [Candidatus Peregrinibacteria bacterium]|nr:hypothetical protein [Candidatus Peregrinibacteria bacterium]